MRGNDSSIWASRFDTQARARTKWKRINAVRVDSADGLGAPYAVSSLRHSLGNCASEEGGRFHDDCSDRGSGCRKLPIPADAIAIMGNLTATGYTGPGFLAISPNGVTVTTSSVNFITGQAAIANSFIVGLSERRRKVQV